MKKQSGNLFVVSAPSGAGKTTVCGEFLNRNPQVKYAISTTTRPPRDGEVDGIHYHFTTSDNFKEMINQNDFLEYANVYGQYYGTSKKEVTGLLEDGFDVLVDVDTQGAFSIKKVLPECARIFILPPSIAELEKRLRFRNKDSDEVIKLRLSKAKDEIKESLNYDYIIINDDLNEAVNCLQSIFSARKLITENNIAKINSLLEAE